LQSGEYVGQVPNPHISSERMRVPGTAIMALVGSLA
jgi:hypothetical protein